LAAAWQRRRITGHLGGANGRTGMVKTGEPFSPPPRGRNSQRDCLSFKPLRAKANRPLPQIAAVAGGADRKARAAEMTPPLG